jgi:hypothetical protein
MNTDLREDIFATEAQRTQRIFIVRKNRELKTIHQLKTFFGQDYGVDKNF